MIQKFLGETLTSLRLFLVDVGENLREEILYLSIFSLSYLAIVALLKMLLHGRDKRILLITKLGILLLGYALIHFMSLRKTDVDLLQVFLVIIYMDVLLTLFKALGMFLRLGRFSSALGRLLIVLSGVFLFFQNLSPPRTLPVYIVGFKLTVALLLTVILMKLYSALIDRTEKPIVKRFLRRARPFLLVLYLALTLAWVFGAVKLSQTFLIKLSALIGTLIAFIMVQVYTLSKLEALLGEDFKPLREDLRRFLSLILLFVLYRGLDILFNLDPILNLLREIHLINTELVKISALSILESLYVFFLLWYLTAIVKDGVYTYYIKGNREIEAGSFRALVSNLGILLAVIVALMNLGLTWKVMVPVAGALGIGLGFGLQTIFNNYISGFILLLSKNIKVGDLVEIEGSVGETLGRTAGTIFGKVVNINVLTTVIRTNDNFEIAIPNSEFISGRIVNYSLSDPYIRVRIPFGVSYSSDPKKVKEVLLRVAKESDLVLKEPPPNVWFYEMGDSALIFYLLVWVDIRKFWRMKALRSELYFRAWEELKKEGIEVPFPQRDVWFKNKLRIEIDERGFPERSPGGGKESP